MTSSTSSTNQVLENHAGLWWNIMIAAPLWPCGKKFKLNILVDHRPVHWHRQLHTLFTLSPIYPLNEWELIYSVQNLGSKFGAFCVYKFIPSRLSRSKWQKYLTWFSQPISRSGFLSHFNMDGSLTHAAEKSLHCFMMFHLKVIKIKPPHYRQLFFQANKQSEQLVVNKPNILDRPKKVSSAGGGGGVTNNNANAASGGSGAAQVDIRKLTVEPVQCNLLIQCNLWMHYWPCRWL